MSEDSYLLNPKEKKKRTPYEWLMLFLRICFFLSAIVLVVITVLANMGGNGETWHDGVKGFISDFAGRRPVNLGKLNNISFFPSVSLDIEGVEILTEPDDTVPIIKLEALRASMPFFDVATRSPRIRDLYVSGLSTIKGVFIPHELSINKLFIDHDQVSPQATLRADGKVGLQSWSLEAGLDVHKSITGKNTYVLAPRSSLTFDFADVHFSGTYNHVSSSHLKLEDFELRAGNKVVRGNFVISMTGDKLMKLQGALDIQGGRTVISPDFVMDLSHKDGAPAHLSGEIKSEKLVIDDLIGKESVFSILARLRELLGYGGVVHKTSLLGRNDMNLHVFLQNVEAGTAKYEALSFDVLKEDGRIRISDVVGKDERKLTPPIMLLQERDSDLTSVVVQDGALDIGLIRPWLKNLPLEFSAKQNTSVICGAGTFGKNEQSKFALDTSDGIISAGEASLGKGQSYFDLNFALSDSEGLDNLELPKQQYDFVQASLQKKGSGSPCASFISLKKQEEPEE